MRTQISCQSRALLALAVLLSGGPAMAQFPAVAIGGVCAGGHLYICAPAAECCMSEDPNDDAQCEMIVGNATVVMGWNAYNVDGSCVYAFWPEPVVCQEQDRFGLCELTSFTFSAHACSPAEQQKCPSPSCGTLSASSVCKLDDIVDANEPPVTPPPDPYPPPQATDTLFLGSGPPPDFCQYRSQGPLTFFVPIYRHVGDTDPQGRLLDPDTLIANGVVTSSALLTMPAFDVDFTANVQKYAPERDRITVNGHDIGPDSGKTYLSGSDKAWVLNKYSLPITLLNFGIAVPGQAAIPGINTIQISIDEANQAGGKEPWCTSVDWTALSFDALAPVVLVHGNNSNNGFFTKFDFTKPFKDQKIPYDNSITMESASIDEHAAYLATEIPAIAAQFGAKHVHLVVHSKGGLDSRQFLARTIPPNFGVLSLTTLATPHHGSSGADYQLDTQGVNPAFSDNRWRTFAAKLVRVNPGTKYLRVSFLREFNRQNDPELPSRFTVDGVTDPITYMSISDDANLDGSSSSGGPTISLDEAAGAIPSVPGLARLAGTTAYRTLYYVAETRQCTKTIAGREVLAVCETPTKWGQLNDLAVTLRSARHTRFREIASLKSNHATIARPDTATQVINTIRGVQPLSEPR